MKPHLLILDPATKSPELQTLNRFLLTYDFRFSYHLPGLFGMASLQRLEEKPDGIIILGSYSSVNDKFIWQQTLAEWLTPFLKKGTPTLGICFGHQWLAHLHGAKVDFVWPDHHKFVGFRDVKIDKNRLGLPTQTAKLFYSHCEQVVSLPKGFTRIAQSAEVPFEALEHTELPIWTFQAHPEAEKCFASDRGDKNCPDNFQVGKQILQLFLNKIGR